MFKKKKNKTKEDILSVESKQQDNQPPKISADSSILADVNANDDVDGFDSQGFVDLTPAEHQPKLLGPKQSCQYIGTFAVSLGTGKDGESTLTTHKERTRFVKKKLREYRYAQKGVDVALLISTDGIKVISEDGQRVRMAHALQRISFATCEPEFRLFAYMSHNPSPLGTAIHCHVFITRHTRQVQNLTALIGKAFQVAFAESKFPKGAELKMEPLIHTSSEEKVVQGRRWARVEARQGHEHSQHALLARLKKEQEKLQNKSPNTSRDQATPTAPSVQNSTSSPQASPLGRRRSFGKAHTPPEVRRLNLKKEEEKSQNKTPNTPRDQATPRASSSPQASPLARRRSFGKAHTPPEVRRSHLPQRNGGGNEALQREQRSNLSDDVVTDAVIDGSSVMESKHVKTTNTSQVQAEDQKITALACLGQTTQNNHQEQNFHVQREKERPLSSAGNVARERSQTPPPSKNDHNSVVVSTEQNLLMSPLKKSASDPNLLAQGSNKHESVSKRDSHEDEDWYMPGIPREFVTEMLENSEEGSFFVRDSQSRPGCYALTMRVSREANTSGFGNFLIVKVKDGVMIQGFDKVLRDVTSLVEHYSQHADGLPCKLLIAGSNVLCEDEEYMNMVPVDPDYQSLSDFTAMMAELS